MYLCTHMNDEYATTGYLWQNVFFEIKLICEQTDLEVTFKRVVTLLKIQSEINISTNFVQHILFFHLIKILSFKLL